MRQMIRTTLIGGVLFLIPLAFVAMIVGKAFQVMKIVATPLGRLIPYDHFAGFIVVDLITVIMLILLCFGAGLLARSPAGKRANARLDAALLQFVPAYAWMKGMTGTLRDDEAEKILKPVWIRFDDQNQLGYEVDRLKSGMVAVFLPGAPDPRSGAVTYVEPERVEPLSTGVTTVAKIQKNLGRGSMEVLGT